jgi:GAF domain-containing protein
VSNAKKKPEPMADNPDMPTDREEGLAKNFEDPALEGILLDFSEPGDPAAVLNETAEAIQELLGAVPAEEVTDLQAEASVEEAVDPIQLLSEPNFDPPTAHEIFDPSNADSGPIVAMEENVLESLQVNARWEMAEKLFELVICDRPFSDMVESILQAVVSGMGAEAGSVLELDSERQEFFFRASIGGGDREQLKSFRVPANKGIVGHVAESRASVLLQDLNTDELQLRAISAGTGFETHTCIASPIILANQMYGVIEIFNKTSGGSFCQRDVELMEDTIRMAVKILEVRFLTAELARRVR